MKRLLLLFSFCLLSYEGLQAQIFAQLGNDTLLPPNTLYSPIYRFSATSTTRGSVSNLLFEEQELLAAGFSVGSRIDSIAFQKPTNASSTNGFLFRVLIGSSTRTSPLPTNLNWGTVITGKQVVFDQSAYVLRPDTGWYTIAFSSPFIYQGGNLEIATLADFGTSGVGSLINGPLRWRYTDGFGGYSIGNTISATVSNTTALSGTSSELKQRPNIRFYLAPTQGNDAGLRTINGLVAPMAAGSNQLMSISVLNSGTNVISNITLNYQVNQGPVVSQTFTTNLNSGDNASVTFTTPITIPSGQSFEVRSWVSQVNGTADINASNDTITANYCIAIPAGIVSVGTNGTYSDLATVLNQLSCGGVTGPLTIDILENQTGNFSLGSIPGSASGAVVITASSPVTISNAGTGSLFILNGTSNLTIQNLNFERTAVPSTSNFLLLGENTSNISVIGNTFQGIVGSTSANNNLVRFNNSQFITFIQNQLRDGNVAYQANSANALRSSLSHTVSGNSFSNNFGSVILMDGAGGVNQALVEGNTITHTNTQVPSTTADAIALVNVSSSTVRGNAISGNIGRYGIHLSNYNGTAVNPNQVINNVVSGLVASTTGNALRLTSLGSALVDRDYARVVNNSFHMRTATTSTTANGVIFITGGTATAPTVNGVDFRNNLVSIGHTGTRPRQLRMLHFSNRVYIDSSFAVFSNNHYNNGNDSLVHIVTPVQTFANLSEWQALSAGLDQNSSAGDPLVLGLLIDDLRPSPGSPLINAGLFQQDITSDIRGASRDAQPDIGAYEFVPLLNSAAMVGIISPNAGPLQPGNSPVTVRFTNRGTNVINSLQLSYQLGTSPVSTESWTGTLNPGDSLNYTFTSTLTVPTVGFIGLEFKVWTGLPNGQNELDLNDDTITRQACIPILAGTYTVGNINSDFPDVASWVNYLNCAGISGPVVFNMDFPNNAYTANTLSFINVPGVSPTNTLVFNGQGDTVRFEAVTGNRALIYLENTDHVTIRNFNLVSTAANFGIGIHLNGADSVRIIGNRIDLSAVTSTSTTQTNGIIASASPTAFTATTAQALFIDSNVIIGGNSGIRVVGNSANKSRNLYIGRNLLRDFYQNGVFMIQVDSAIVENNEINRALRTGVTTFQGVNLEAGAEGVMVRNNRIHSSHNSATTRTAASFGVRISSPGNLAKRNYVVNNLIYGFITTGNQNGILLNVASMTDVLYNTIVLQDSLASGAARAIYLQGLNQNVRILNNNLVVNKEGTGEKQVLYLERDTTSLEINFNNYYTTSTTGTVNLLHLGSTGYPSLAAWRAAFPRYDSLSTNGNPLFVNTTLADYTPTSSVLDGAATPIAFVPTDLNGNVRGTLPDMGALEFTPAQIDLAAVQFLTDLNDGCVPSLQIPIEVRVTNVGNSNIDTVYLSYQINSQAVSRDTLFNGITSGTILNYTFRQPGSFTNGLDTIVVIAKGKGDLNASNDTLRRVVNNFQATILQIPYNQDFESATIPTAFCVSGGDSSRVLIQGATVANLPITGNSSLIMMGSNSGTPWTAPTVNNWWNINALNLSEATIYVNVAGRRRMDLAFNLRQLFATTASNNNFRLLVNGIAVTPVGGSSPTLRPVNSASSSTTIPLLYRLDSLLSMSDTMVITFQSSVRFSTSNTTPNGNAIDDLRLLEPEEVRFSNLTRVQDLCTAAPQLISITLDTLNSPTNVNLNYGSTGTYTSVAMQRGATAGEWQATLPAIAPLSRVAYFVSAQSGSTTSNSDTALFNNVAFQVDLGPDRNISLGQSDTLRARLRGISPQTVFFTEFMHWKSPTANIQTTYPTGVPNNADDMIELTNLGTDTFDLAGKRMILFGGPDRWVLNFPTGARLAPNAVAVIMPGQGTNNLVNNVYYMGGTNNNVLTSTERNGAVLIDTVTTNVVDVVLTNDSILPADLNLPANLWTGRINSNSLTGIRRISTSGRGTANWALYSAVDTTSFGYFNTNLQVLPNANLVEWFVGNTPVGTGYALGVSPTTTTTYHVSMPVRGCIVRDTVIVNVSTVSLPDLTVSRIVSPVSGTTNISAPLVPRIWVRNRGTAAANGFSVNMEVNGTSVGVQNFTQSIAANDSIEVSLNNWNPASGTYEVCFTVSNPDEIITNNNRLCVAAVQIANTTSVGEVNALGVRLYPNPAHSTVNIELPDATEGYYLQWMDAAGRQLGSLSHEAGAAAHAVLDVQNLASGIYYLRIQNKEGQFSHLRFVVAR